MIVLAETRGFFFFNDTATTEIYTLSLHDALPILNRSRNLPFFSSRPNTTCAICPSAEGDRKSTRLNSSHGYISYAVFCLKKKKTWHDNRPHPVLQSHAQLSVTPTNTAPTCRVHNT